MKRFERAFVSAIAVALLAGATPATAQDIVLTSGADGDLRATWDGEEPAEFVLVTATVDREGNVLDRTRGKMIVLKPGQDINVGRVGIPDPEDWTYDELRPVTDPVAYTPDRDGLPGKKYFVTNLPGLLDRAEKPRTGKVAAGPSGTGKTMGESDGENSVNDPPTFTEKDTTVEPDNDERAMPRVKTNTVRKPAGRVNAGDADHVQPDAGARGIKPDRGGKDVFYLVTLVPADERAPRVNVQPVILHGAAPDDKPDW